MSGLMIGVVYGGAVVVAILLWAGLNVARLVYTTLATDHQRMNAIWQLETQRAQAAQQQQAPLQQQGPAHPPPPTTPPPAHP